MCFVVKLHYVIVLCGAERVRTISHESLQCLCFERLPQVALEQKTLLHDRNSAGTSWIWRGPASGRGGSAHRLRSGRLEPRGGLPLRHLGLGAVPPQWWRNAKIDGSAMTLDVHHSWRPSTSENNFLSRNLAEPVADAPLCCARAPAHRHVAPRRPRSELLTWQRLRCPKGSCIGKRGEGRWWVRSPANSRTSFSEGQKDYRKFDTGFR